MTDSLCSLPWYDSRGRIVSRQTLKFKATWRGLLCSAAACFVLKGTGREIFAWDQQWYAEDRSQEKHRLSLEGAIEWVSLSCACLPLRQSPDIYSNVVMWQSMYYCVFLLMEAPQEHLWPEIKVGRGPSRLLRKGAWLLQAFANLFFLPLPAWKQIWRLLLWWLRCSPQDGSHTLRRQKENRSLCSDDTVKTLGSHLGDTEERFHCRSLPPISFWETLWLKTLVLWLKQNSPLVKEGFIKHDLLFNNSSLAGCIDFGREYLGRWAQRQDEERLYESCQPML